MLWEGGQEAVGAARCLSCSENVEVCCTPLFPHRRRSLHTQIRHSLACRKQQHSQAPSRLSAEPFPPSCSAMEARPRGAMQTSGEKDTGFLQTRTKSVFDCRSQVARNQP